MINTIQFGKKLKERGFGFYSGVPCSFLNNLINYAINDCRYVMAANEGEAVAISSGAVLAGQKAVVLMQNSGLTNAVSPLTSLNHTFRLPVLGFVSLRGEEGIGDEPQHELMGRITEKMLSLMEVESDILADDTAAASAQLERAAEVIAENRSFFFIVKKNRFSEVTLQTAAAPAAVCRVAGYRHGADDTPPRLEALKVINGIRDASLLFLVSTGKGGREFYELGDHPNNFYMVGSMGAVSSLGLGINLARRDMGVVAIDGDGALLMRLGSLAANAAYSRGNFLHILLDNHTHDSTGGQFTLAANVDFVAMAAAAGYPRACYAHSLGELILYLQHWRENRETTFIYLKTAPRSKKDLGRPKIKPYQVKERLMDFIKSAPGAPSP